MTDRRAQTRARSADNDELTQPQTSPVAELHLGDCLERMAALPAASVDLILTDPPYFRVKDDAWDRQWDNAAAFLGWIGQLCDQWRRILKPNGSLYCFASPKMAARVECKIGERFNPLTHIVWRKEAGAHRRQHKEGLRAWFPQTERIVFAEPYGADAAARGEAGYAAKCAELRSFVFEPLRAYLDGERRRAGVTPRECNAACGNQMAGHYFTAVQWAMPTRENYEKLRAFFNARAAGESCLARDFPLLRWEYEFLRRDYELLRREYDELRAEYDALRRPFAVTAAVPYTDVWDFAPVPPRPGKHPCEKPQALLRHIIEASSRPGAVVLDCFLGSGSTGEAALTLGRSFIGMELDPGYFAGAKARIDAAVPRHVDTPPPPVHALGQARGASASTRPVIAPGQNGGPPWPVLRGACSSNGPVK